MSQTLSQTDFPAAHSMDTEWFAVDADGVVALFISGEGGAAPEGYIQESPSSELFFKHFTPELVFSAKDLIATEDTTSTIDLSDHGVGRFNNDERLLLLVKSEECYEQLLALNVACKRLPSDAGIFVYCESLDDDLAKEISKRGYVLRSWSNSSDTGFEIRRWGLVVYECGYQAPMPYTRTSTPSNPLTINRVPEPIKELANKVQLHDIRFMQVDSIQPPDHFACEAWGFCYVSADGKWIRFFPRRIESKLRQFFREGHKLDELVSSWRREGYAEAEMHPDALALAEKVQNPVSKSWWQRLFG